MTEKRVELTNIYNRLTRNFVEVCTNCGACLEACPMFPLTKFAD